LAIDVDAVMGGFPNLLEVEGGFDGYGPGVEEGEEALGVEGSCGFVYEGGNAEVICGGGGVVVGV